MRCGSDTRTHSPVSGLSTETTMSSFCETRCRTYSDDENEQLGQTPRPSLSEKGARHNKKDSRKTTALKGLQWHSNTVGTHNHHLPEFIAPAWEQAPYGGTTGEQGAYTVCRLRRQVILLWGVGIIMASIRQLGVIDGLTAGLTSIDIVPER